LAASWVLFSVVLSWLLMSVVVLLLKKPLLWVTTLV
jgi:hypothetical protein